jgi:hypothetical protein
MKTACLSTVVIALVLIVASCEVPFDPTAPAKSTPYVMCVLNPKDSAQYVRVQKSYVCKENAYTYSAKPDSIYYKPDEVEVLLIRFDTLDGSIMDKPIRFYPTDEIPKDSGGFSSQGHYLFKTLEPIYSKFDYELSIRLIKENKTYTSRLQPLGSWNLKDAFGSEQRKLKYNLYHPERMDYFQDLTPSNYPQYIRFLFLEMTGEKSTPKYVEYIQKFNDGDQSDPDYDALSFLGKDFLFRFIQREIPEIKGVRRIAVGVDFMIQLADSNLLMYQRVANPDSKFLYTTEFNNIRNGAVGLFASRYKYTIFGKALKPAELDSISLGQYTRKLNFADSRGKFHDGK